MLIRCAFFRGHVKPGMEDAFFRHVHEQLVPLWTQFPGVQEVRVLRQRESDVDDPHLAMVMAMRFETMADIEKALASDIRYQSKEESKRLFEMFDGSVFHTVFDAEQFKP